MRNSHWQTTATSPNKMVCRDVLALMDRVSLVNGLKPVREMPMSLLEYTAWTSPNVWIRTAYCSATYSATLSSLTSVVPTKRKARQLQTCQAARWPTHASATITCSTLLPASRALHPVPYFPRLSRSQSGFSPSSQHVAVHLSRNNSQTSGGDSTTKTRRPQ